MRCTEQIVHMLAVSVDDLTWWDSRPVAVLCLV